MSPVIMWKTSVRILPPGGWAVTSSTAFGLLQLSVAELPLKPVVRDVRVAVLKGLLPYWRPDCHRRE